MEEGSKPRQQLCHSEHEKNLEVHVGPEMKSIFETMLLFLMELLQTGHKLNTKWEI